jgi:predicted phosphodiesterase
VRFLILSDIHANIEALEAVMADANGSYDQIVCCGDLVGYNPDPAAIVEWTEAHCASVIRGNHDKVVAGIDDLEWFNPAAQASARWTQAQLSPSQIEYLHNLPRGPRAVDGFDIVHGAPFDEDEYVVSTEAAAESFASLRGELAFFGHSHLQGGYFQKWRHIGNLDHVRADEPELVIVLEHDTLYLVNPGSVGQPRDGDPRAAYAIYDTESRWLRFRRVAYNIELTAAKIRKAGLPDVLGMRLFRGQ